MDGIPIRIDLIDAGAKRLRSSKPYPVFTLGGRTRFALALALALAVTGFATAGQAEPDQGAQPGIVHFAVAAAGHPRRGHVGSFSSPVGPASAAVLGPRNALGLMPDGR